MAPCLGAADWAAGPGRHGAAAEAHGHRQRGLLARASPGSVQCSTVHSPGSVVSSQPESQQKSLMPMSVMTHHHICKVSLNTRLENSN